MTRTSLIYQRSQHTDWKVVNQLVSMTTDVVFITSHRKTADRFKQIVKEAYDRYAEPYEAQPVVTQLDDNGPKCAGTYIFYIGFNYMNTELEDALRREPWADDVILRIESEDAEQPLIQVGQSTIHEERPY
jgi:hypothetical protein